MMPNGTKVNWEALHKEIMAQSEERHGMELRLINAFADGMKLIRDDMQAERTACNERFGCIERDVVTLKVADRKWGGIVGLFAAVAAAVGGVARTALNCQILRLRRFWRFRTL